MENKFNILHIVIHPITLIYSQNYNYRTYLYILGNISSIIIESYTTNYIWTEYRKDGNYLGAPTISIKHHATTCAGVSDSTGGTSLPYRNNKEICKEKIFVTPGSLLAIYTGANDGNGENEGYA